MTPTGTTVCAPPFAGSSGKLPGDKALTWTGSPSLAVGGGNTRTWYARSRSRVATGLLLTAPGIPMLFMGQEFYEDKRWADDVPNHRGTLVYWEGLNNDKTMIDFHRFTRELIWLRRKHPALRGEGVRTLSMENAPRVLVFQRWVEGVGRDVIVVASLNESTLNGYQIPMLWPGLWLEVFNSDVYANWVNPGVAGNGGSVHANGPGLNGLPHFYVRHRAGEFNPGIRTSSSPGS